jgi:hypothetical protein
VSTLRISDFPIGFRGYTFNSHRSTAGAASASESAHKDTTVVQSFDISPVQVRDQREALHAVTGGDFGTANEVFRFISMLVKIKASTGENLEDEIAKIVRVGSLEEALLDYPTTMGASALDFYCPTNISSTGIASPVHEKFLVRPAGPAAWVERAQDGLTALVSLSFVAADPRRYLYAAPPVAFPGAGSQALPNWNTTQGRKVYPLVTIVLSGAGAANLTISDGTTSLVLDMGSVTAGTFTIDMATQQIKKGTTVRADLRTSGVNTFWGIPAGGVAAATITNRTNITTSTITYNQARA